MSMHSMHGMGSVKEYERPTETKVKVCVKHPPNLVTQVFLYPGHFNLLGRSSRIEQVDPPVPDGFKLVASARTDSVPRNVICTPRRFLTYMRRTRTALCCPT